MMLAVLFGAAGMGYFAYGKKEQHGIAMVSGVALCVFPYFVSQPLVEVLIGAALLALPFLSRS